MFFRSFKTIALLILIVFAGQGMATTVSAVTEVFPPFQFYNERGKLTGVAVDLIKEADKLIGTNTKISVYPWARALTLAEKQDDLMIFSISRTPERTSKFTWFYLFDIDNRPYVWTLRKKRFEGGLRWSDLLKLNTAIPRGDTQYEFLLDKGFAPKSNLFVTNNFGQAINMLIAGRVEFVFAGQTSMMTQLSNADLPAELFVPTTIETSKPPPLGFAFNKNANQIIIEQYRQAFETLSKSGRIEAVLEQYMYISD